jgi:hypothetical protein
MRLKEASLGKGQMLLDVISHAQGITRIRCVHETTCRGNSEVLVSEFEE